MRAIDAAIDLRRQGLSVVPVIPGTKRPPTTWAARQTILPTEEQLVKDWEDSPKSGVAIITGQVSGVVVVDIDPKRATAQSLAMLDKDLSTRFKDCPRVRTGGGGIHLYFAAPHQHTPNAVDLYPGFDIRADGGLVVAPPTKHASGKNYAWEVPFSRNSLLPLPHEFTPKSEQKNGAKTHWIEAALEGAPDGSRNDTCTRLAGYFLGKGVAPDIVVSVLDTTYGQRCTPPMSRREIESTVGSVYRREGHHTKQTKKFEVTHINDFMASHADASTNWTIDEWMPEGSVVMMVAPPGSYKTWLLLDLALSLATEAPFLGKYPVRSSGPVILVQQEDHKSGIASRFAKIWGSRFPITVPKNDGDEFILPEKQVPIWVHETRSLRLDSQESIASLGEQIEKIRPRAVLIDPLYSTISTDDYMAGAAEQMMTLKTLRDKFGCSFVFAHHTRKKQDEGRLGAWGSQFLNAFIETGWQIRRINDEDETISVVRHHKVAAPMPAVTLEWQINDNDYSVTVAGVEAIGDVSQAILTALATKPHTIQELAEVMKVHRSTISRRLKAMSEDNMVVKKNDLWSLSPNE